MSAATRVVYRPTRPDLTIQVVPGGSSRMCYSETHYELVRRGEPLDDEDLRHLDACGLLGIGQAYRVLRREEFAEAAPPVEVDAQGRPTGRPPTHYTGEVLTNTVDYTYHRVVVERICDSGD